VKVQAGSVGSMGSGTGVDVSFESLIVLSFQFVLNGMVMMTENSEDCD
jgi:hypothetical protein